MSVFSRKFDYGHSERLGCWNFVAAVNNNGGIDLEDVQEILAQHEGKRDRDYWVWLLRVKGGYKVAKGGCDYTGWDCRSTLGFSPLFKSVKKAINFLPKYAEELQTQYWAGRHHSFRDKGIPKED